SRPRKSRVAFIASTVLLLYLLSFVPAWLRDSSPHSNRLRPSKLAIEAGAEQAPAIELKAPIHISELPPAVESAKQISFPGQHCCVTQPKDGFDRAAGPRHPKVLWKTQFPSVPGFLGIAEDGTLYFAAEPSTTDERAHAIYAIRDGKQLWGYKLPSSVDLSRDVFAADGRIWAEQNDKSALGQERQFFVYNSRGEGGLTTVKQSSKLLSRQKKSWVDSGSG